MAGNYAEITVEPGVQELIITREFNAPRGVVWKALTDPEIYKKWIGPRGLTTEMGVFQSKDGGAGGTSRKTRKATNSHSTG